MTHTKFLQQWHTASEVNVSLYFKGGDIDLVSRILHEESQKLVDNTQLYNILIHLKNIVDSLHTTSTDTYCYFGSGYNGNNMVISMQTDIPLTQPIVYISNKFYLQPLMDEYL